MCKEYIINGKIVGFMIDYTMKIFILFFFKDFYEYSF